MFFLLSINISAQVFTFTSNQQGQEIIHKILVDSDYLIETRYNSESNVFVSTRGGFYQKNKEGFDIRLEFNSNYTKDSLKRIKLVPKGWKKSSLDKQIHYGKWLMAGRVGPEGEKRRTINGPRKTLKFLLDGHFQWTAFNTESFKFYGSGGGIYFAKDGDYVESIVYFSRDDSKSGAVLPFDYELRGSDWYHKGLNSKGEPMHEIWTQRKN
tara:strand:+ start:15342 stop:15974 length:633 start_codon:yes stop_codon:yes gene_type:complete